MITSTPTCPNCGKALSDHGADDCVLSSLVQVLRERGKHSEATLSVLHSQCDTDRLWNELALIVDRLGRGEFTAQERRQDLPIPK